MRQKYYSDGTTRISAPFYACICPAGHAFWSVLPQETCRECGQILTNCTTADTKKRPAATDRK